MGAAATLAQSEQQSPSWQHAEVPYLRRYTPFSTWQKLTIHLQPASRKTLGILGNKLGGVMFLYFVVFLFCKGVETALVRSTQSFRSDRTA